VTVVSEALKGLKVGPRRIAERSGIQLERVRSILAGDAPAISEVRAIASGLRIPIHLLAQKTPPSDAAGTGLLFRNARRDDTSYDVTVEKVASFVEAALDILPDREAPPA